MALLRTIIGVIIVRSASSAITQNFAFQVFQVESCPMSKVDWDSASKRLNCNTTHGYHCVPDKYFTSLIEFCYPHGYRLPFERGNCLELAANGILNHVPCHSTFSSGCPSQFYFSNELYKYQKCLSINTELGCFDADVPCILEKSGFNTTNHTINSVSPVNCTALDKTPSCKTNDTTCTASIVFIFLLFFIIFGMCALFIRAIYWNKRKVYHSKNPNRLL
ncbi:uncharacterized protein LOC134280816 [Saccostrea cucullata]|uniref:uncharacterized protein LOC134280816 n=1 Tax=Saccostrea cuccullata TaxID=36930 RepID=UPI002ECFCB59